MPKFIVKSTSHPRAKGLANEHGPFDDRETADGYAARLRKSGEWGEISVEVGTIRPPKELDDIFRFDR